MSPVDDEQRPSARTVAGSGLNPLPSPAEFESILPGSADRILTLVELEYKHRAEIDNRLVTLDERELELREAKLKAEEQLARRAQTLAFAVVVIFVAVAVVAVMLKQPIMAIGFAGIGMVGVVAAFLRLGFAKSGGKISASETGENTP